MVCLDFECFRDVRAQEGIIEKRLNKEACLFTFTPRNDVQIVTYRCRWYFGACVVVLFRIYM